MAKKTKTKAAEVTMMMPFHPVDMRSFSFTTDGQAKYPMGSERCLREGAAYVADLQSKSKTADKAAETMGMDESYED